MNIRQTAAVYAIKRGFLKAFVSIHVETQKSGPTLRSVAAGLEPPNATHTADTPPMMNVSRRTPLGKPWISIR